MSVVLGHTAPEPPPQGWLELEWAQSRAFHAKGPGEIAGDRTALGQSSLDQGAFWDSWNSSGAQAFIKCL